MIGSIIGALVALAIYRLARDDASLSLKITSKSSPHFGHFTEAA